MSTATREWFAPNGDYESPGVFPVPFSPDFTYEPEHLKRWTLPPHYMGAEWPEWFVFLGRNRDSDALERSNFRSALEAVGGETDTVLVIEESHWAVGWVQWIGIHQSDTEALRSADAVMADLDNYPVVDEGDFSALEDEEADEVWRSCYDVKERVRYIREHRRQFEFRSLADMLGCVRGNYFAGYASELLA